MDRIEIRDLIVTKDGRVMALGGPPAIAPDWYEIDPEFRLVMFGWREKPSPCGHEHCKSSCDYQRLDEEMKGGETAS